MLKAIQSEIEMNQDYFGSGDVSVNSIYFGGGTPSLLKPDELEIILNSIHRHFKVVDPEITLESNPDDLNKEGLKSLLEIGVNRLSVGIQSFDDTELEMFNRAHNSADAKAALDNIFQVGFENITADLIYGIPGSSLKSWEENLNTLLQYPINHISAYALTFEEKTPFGKWLKTGKINECDEALVNDQFKLLMDTCSEHGYVHYEISNFAKNEQFSRHNSNYWKGIPYLGLGPSAHSFNGKSRRWNLSVNHTYMKALQKGEPYFEEERLSQVDRLNEYLLTSLRTSWGCDLEYVLNEFGAAALEQLKKEAKSYLNEGHLVEDKMHWFLSEKGKFVADKITSDLFAV